MMLIFKFIPGVRRRKFGLAAVIVEMLLRVEFWIVTEDIRRYSPISSEA